MASRSGSNSRPLADFEVNIIPSDIEDKDVLVELRKPDYGTVATKKGHLQSIIAAKDSLSSKCPQVLREVFNKCIPLLDELNKRRTGAEKFAKYYLAVGKVLDQWEKSARIPKREHRTHPRELPECSSKRLNLF